MFIAAVQKVQTLADCGIRVTLDLPETAIMQMAELAECKRAGIALRFEASPELQVGSGAEHWTVAAGGKWKSQRQAKKE